MILSLDRPVSIESNLITRSEIPHTYDSVSIYLSIPSWFDFISTIKCNTYILQCDVASACRTLKPHMFIPHCDLNSISFLFGTCAQIEPQIKLKTNSIGKHKCEMRIAIGKIYKYATKQKIVCITRLQTRHLNKKCSDRFYFYGHRCKITFANKCNFTHSGWTILFCIHFS